MKDTMRFPSAARFAFSKRVHLAAARISRKGFRAFAVPSACVLLTTVPSGRTEEPDLKNVIRFPSAARFEFSKLVQFAAVCLAERRHTEKQDLKDTMRFPATARFEVSKRVQFAVTRISRNGFRPLLCPQPRVLPTAAPSVGRQRYTIFYHIVMCASRIRADGRTGLERRNAFPVRCTFRSLETYSPYRSPRLAQGLPRPRCTVSPEFCRRRLLPTGDKYILFSTI